MKKGLIRIGRVYQPLSAGFVLDGFLDLLKRILEGKVHYIDLLDGNLKGVWNHLRSNQAF